MNVKFVFRYSLNYFVMNIRRFIGIMIMLFLTTIICGAVLFLYGEKQYIQKMMENVLSGDLGNVGVLQWEKNEDKIGSVWNEMKQIPSFSNCGFYGNLFLKKDGSAFSKMLSGEADLGKWIKIHIATDSMLDYVELPVVKENLPKEMDEDVWYLFLGSKYKQCGLKNGTEIVLDDLDGGTHRFRICGYLESGNQWLDSEFGSGVCENVCHSVDYDILAFGGERYLPYMEQAVISTKKGEDWEKFSLAVTNAFEQEEMHAGIRSVQNMIREREVSGNEAKSYLKKMMFLLMPVCLMMMVSAYTVAVLNSRKQFGIWYACGAGQSDVVSILILNSVFMTGVVAVVAFGLGYAAVLRLYDVSLHSRVKQVLWQSVFPWTGIFLVSMNAIGIIMPIRVLKKYSSSELINNSVK